MSYKLKQRFPNCFSGFIQEECEFSTLEDLHKINFIKKWISNKNFKKLSISIRKASNQHILMCEMNDGSYYAIGWIYGVEDMKSGLSEFKK